MNNKYFDVDSFLRDYKLNEDKLKFLKYKLNSVIDSTGMDYQNPKVSGGLPHSSVESKAAQRERIRAEIQEIEGYFEQYESLLKGLSRDERYIAEEYFKQGKKTRYDVDRMADKLCCSTATMYRKIKTTRRKIKENALGGGA